MAIINYDTTEDALFIVNQLGHIIYELERCAQPTFRVGYRPYERHLWEKLVIMLKMIAPVNVEFDDSKPVNLAFIDITKIPRDELQND